MADPCIVNSPRIAFSVSGTPRALSGDIIVSGEPGNIYQNAGDGAYVPGLTWQNTPTFPTTPVDGMIVAFQINQSTTWQFRYNAASTNSLKWEFIGGGDFFSDFDGISGDEGSVTAGGGTSGAWASLVGTSGVAGPDIILPVAGHFTISFGAQINSATDGSMALVGISIGAGNDPTGYHTAGHSSTHWITVARTIHPTTTIAGGTRLRLMYFDASGGGASLFRYRWMSVRPLRCSN